MLRWLVCYVCGLLSVVCSVLLVVWYSLFVVVVWCLCWLLFAVIGVVRLVVACCLLSLIGVLCRRVALFVVVPCCSFCVVRCVLSVVCCKCCTCACC